MGLFELLHGARHRASSLDDQTRNKLIKAWGLDGEEVAARRPEQAADGLSLDYDRVQWLRKLKHVLDELPDSEQRWPQLVTEARAKGFDEAWMRRMMTDEFALMARRAVADQYFDESERRRLDLARYLIGLTEKEAQAIFQSVVSEAEAFFGGHVRNG